MGEGRSTCGLVFYPADDAMTTDMERRRWQPSAGERSFCNHQALHTLLCGIQVQTHYNTVAWLFLSAVTIDCPVTTPLLESLQ